MPAVLNKDIENFENDGFCVLRSAIAPEQIEQLKATVESLRQEKAGAGLRNLLTRSPEIKRAAISVPLFEIAQRLLRSKAFPVRAILFDKTPGTNWYVTWHQDLSIPVQEHLESDGYGPWSVKDDVVHVQPPAEILGNMVSLRVHLDSCFENNGPIKFIVGSHLSGILATPAIEKWRADHTAVICTAECGDIIAMRPLILHSSSVAASPEHRRVLHLEYATGELANGLQWAEA